MFDNSPVLYRGSVKNVRGVVSDPSLIFEFSDRFSVFDWGEMPNELQEKGKSLAIMGKCFFRHFENTHYWKELKDSDLLKKHFDSTFLDSLWKSTTFQKFCNEGLSHHAVLDDKNIGWDTPFLKVKNIDIHRPVITDGSYDYSFYQNNPTNCLVPLEVIYRIGLAPGNSLSKRLGSNLEAWKNYGFKEIPGEGIIPFPIIDFSTKLEPGDRYLSSLEAKGLANLSTNEFDELVRLTQLVALNLFVFHNEIDLLLWDGKIELAWTEDSLGRRRFMLVDSVGIDEIRLTHKGKSFSKEFLREFYKNSSWYRNLESAKNESLHIGMNFKTICLEKYLSSPESLDDFTKTKAKAIYKSYANEVSMKVLGINFFESNFNLAQYSKRYL
ncbi:MAG: hypothetical protein HOP07_12735 [Bacteriovoracaceae bacterium]|nr:hypothetical protein [Bacteriovoracaceae bacterium]